MMNKALILALLPFLMFFACNSSKEEKEDTFTATINDEHWEFYDLSTNRNGEDVEIRGKGYLEGDRGAVPVDLRMTLVGFPDKDTIETPYTAYFTPGTVETAVFATIEPLDSQILYDTKLDPNAQGSFTIQEVKDNVMSGKFDFVAADKTGKKLVVTNGKFNNLSL